MYKYKFFCQMVAVLFAAAVSIVAYSCSASNENICDDDPLLCMDLPVRDPNINNNTLDLYVLIVDSENNDRLNPASPGYLGEEYINGIKTLYLINGAKLTHSERYSFFMNSERRLNIKNFENYTTVMPPFTETEYCPLDNGTSGYYVINISSAEMYVENGDVFTSTYVVYPDGSEDEIIALYPWAEPGDPDYDKFFWRSKIWVNGVLAYESEVYYYYNPDFFPSWFMRPLIGSDDNENRMLPIAHNVIVMTK